MGQLVTYTCGDTQFIFLISSSVRVRRDIIQSLRHVACPACQRRERYEVAHRGAVEAGLWPLQASCQGQLALAEIIRLSLWQVLAQEADQDARQLLAALFNRHCSAAFWLGFRGIALPSPTPAHIGYVVLGLLQTPTKGET